MALKFPWIFKGVQADYFKVTNVISDALENKTYVTLSLYASKEARQQSVQNILTSLDPIAINGVDKKLSDIYTSIKGRKEWKEAKDC